MRSTCLIIAINESKATHIYHGFTRRRQRNPLNAFVDNEHRRRTDSYFFPVFLSTRSFFSHFPFIPSLSLSALQQQFQSRLLRSTQLIFFIIFIFPFSQHSTPIPVRVWSFKFLSSSCFCVSVSFFSSRFSAIPFSCWLSFGGWKIMWALHIFNLLNDLTFFSLHILLLVHIHMRIRYFAIQPHAQLRGFKNSQSAKVLCSRAHTS